MRANVDLVGKVKGINKVSLLYRSAVLERRLDGYKEFVAGTDAIKQGISLL